MVGSMQVQVAPRAPSRKESLRALSILERLASRLGGSGNAEAYGELALQLSEALLPMLAQASGNGGRRGSPGVEAAMLRVLGVLAAVWSSSATADGTGMHHQLCIYIALGISAELPHTAGLER